MAKTTKKSTGRRAGGTSPTGRKLKKKVAKQKVERSVGRQAATEVWSAGALLDALRSGSKDEKLAVLRKAGIIDASGKLSKTYQNWGSKVSRTPDADEPRV